jgi:sec-independent protein translocase protein TatB
VFGFSFGEIMVLLIVGIVVVGPRKLPAMMRTLGQWVGKLRRMSTDLRAQSGIDDLIRQEGIEREIRELRSLSRMNVIETLVTPVAGPAVAGSVVRATPKLPARQEEPEEEEEAPEPPLREREYPLVGCDSYGAYPDDEELYAGEIYEPAADEPAGSAPGAPMAGAKGAEGAA